MSARACTLEHQRLEGAGGAAVAVEKWMHRRQVVVEPEGLDQRIVIAEDGADRPRHLVKGGGAVVAPFRAAMARGAERDVLVAAAEPARFAVVLVTRRDETAMDLEDQIGVHRPVRRHLRDPAVGGDRGGGLPLRAGLELLGCVFQGRVEFLLGELGPLDAGGAGDFSLELDGLKLVGPAPLIGHLGERQYRRLGARQLMHHGGRIVAQPPVRRLVPDDHLSIVSRVVSSHSAVGVSCNNLRNNGFS